MNFKSLKQKGYLFASLADKKKGLNPMEEKSKAKSIDLKQPQAPMKTSPIPKITKLENPTAIPALPGLPKLAKFTKMKKFYK